MENILVAIRFRPLAQQKEVGNIPKLNECWEFSSDCPNTVNNKRSKQSYTFDYIFREDSSNEDIFQTLALPIVQSSLEGMNSTILAYGQTASGKTHTIRGTSDSPGLIRLSLSAIFEDTRYISREFTVKISYLEVYNEQVNDLWTLQKQILTYMKALKKEFLLIN